MKIYRSGLDAEGWQIARRRQLRVGVAKAAMYTYGGMCHEHTGVIICVVAADAEGVRELRDIAMDHFWRPSWLQNESIVIEDVKFYRLWKGCLNIKRKAVVSVV